MAGKQTVKEKQGAYDAYKVEMQKVIKGESPLDRAALNDTQGIYNNLLKDHNKMLSWAQLYERGSLEAKKMVVANIVQKATIKRDYEISLDLNISYEDYLGNKVGNEIEPDEILMGAMA